MNTLDGVIETGHKHLSAPRSRRACSWITRMCERSSDMVIFISLFDTFFVLGSAKLSVHSIVFLSFYMSY